MESIAGAGGARARGEARSERMEPASEEELQELYEWVDEIPLSRPKKNIARDFSDAGTAERTVIDL